MAQNTHFEHMETRIRMKYVSRDENPEEEPQINTKDQKTL